MVVIRGHDTEMPDVRANSIVRSRIHLGEVIDRSLPMAEEGSRNDRLRARIRAVRTTLLRCRVIS